VLLYAMVNGKLPFDDPSIQRLFQKIVYTQPFFPSFLSPALVDLLMKMICKDPEMRIDVELLKVHPWFPQGEFSSMMDILKTEMRESHANSSNATFPKPVQEDMYTFLEQEFEIDSADVDRILARKSKNERMKDLMNKVAKSSAKTMKMSGSLRKRSRSPAIGSAPVVAPKVSPLAPSQRADSPSASQQKSRGMLTKMLILRQQPAQKGSH
jgi:serine/threonine protein kinase